MTKEQRKKMEESVFQKIAFFDLFDYPLSSFEVWQYLDKKVSLSELQLILEKLVEGRSLEILHGFYFLPGRQKIVQTRQARYNYADRKFKRARRVAKLFKIIPWINLVAIGNIIGANNLRDKSDIDLFIITRAGRIWTSRFFCVILMKFLGLRPSPGNEKDKICLSFYVTEKVFDLRKFMLDKNDLYFVYWLAGLAPIYNKNKTYEKFVAANDWLEEYLPNWQSGSLALRRNAGPAWPRWYNVFFDFLFGHGEKILKKFQEKKLPLAIKSKLNQGTCVVVDENVIKLHTNDRRADFISKLNVQLSHSNLEEIADIKEILTKFRKKLPHFSDGRIDYSTSNEAPILNCFIQCEQKILLLKRSNQVATYKNKWNAIAGYIDEEKTVREKTIEEVIEETGLKREQIKQFIQGQPYKFFDANLKRTWIVYPALIKLDKIPEIKLDWEHAEYKWISPEEIKDYDVVPDLEISLRNTLERYEIS